MALFSTLRYVIILCLLISHFETLIAGSNLSFSFKNFGQNSSFDSVLALYGDAKVVNGGLSVQITAPLVYSAGRMIYKKPIKLYAGIPKKLVSFSTYFSFSVSKNGDGLTFLLFPIGYAVDLFDDKASFGRLNGTIFKFLNVEFDSSMDESQVGIDIPGFDFLKVKNVSTVNLVVNSGEKLQAWIDYEAGSRRLEVRLSRFGENRPLDPLLFKQIDLSEVWPENEQVFVGLSSSNGNNSLQTCNVYSWSFTARHAPDGMHSQPVDPKENKTKAPKKSDCVMRVLSALVLGIGCGALGTLVGMFVWTVFGNKRPVVPEEFAVKSVEEHEHKKLMVCK